MSDPSYTLKRRYFPEFTFSTLHRPDGSQVCVMVERAWLDNKPNVSCIPEGDYTLKSTISPKFGACYFLEGGTVSLSGDTERTHILIHAANWPHQLQGCLGVGIDFCCISDQWAVSSSRAALIMLLDEFDGGIIKLRIEAHKL